MKRILAIILVLLMITLTFASCKKVQNNGSDASDISGETLSQSPDNDNKGDEETKDNGDNKNDDGNKDENLNKDEISNGENNDGGEENGGNKEPDGRMEAALSLDLIHKAVSMIWI